MLLDASLCPADLRGQLSRASSDSQCVEDSTWLGRRAHMPVYNNSIFTKGFTYTVEWAGDSTSLAPRRAEFDRLREDIRQAFGSALTYWGVSLLLVRRELDSPLSRHIESSLACDGGNCVYNAPPADRVRCRRNASIAVVIYGAGGPTFPAPQRYVVAQSAKPGRTVLLNSQEFDFGFDQRLFTIWGARRRLNLTAVLAHELGHSFGYPTSQRMSRSCPAT